MMQDMHWLRVELEDMAEHKVPAEVRERPHYLAGLDDAELAEALS